MKKPYDIRTIYNGRGLLVQAACLMLVCICTVFSLPQEAQARHLSTPLPAPAALAAKPDAPKIIDLSWACSDSSSVDGFSIERSQNANSGFVQVATAANTDSTFTDQGLSDSQTYYYRARSFVQKGRNIDYSSYSSTVSATTASAATTSPTTTLAPGAFQFGVSAYSVNEGAGSVNITINRVGGSDGAVTVDWRTLGQTATYGADYGDFDWTTLTFADGETSKTLPVSIVNDTLVEGDETFQVLLGNPTGGATLGTTTTTTVTIKDDDVTANPQPGSFAFGAGTYSVNEGAGKVNITINRVGGSDGAVTVDWRTQGQTATYGADYGDFTWTTLTFAGGETSKTLPVSIVDDTQIEGNETFQVLLGNPTGGATLGSITTSTVTIVDNDTTATPAPAPDPSLGYLPVFPGAQGFGTETPAGRGGKIIKVTNLNDSGSGSLRAALTASGPRIVVFEVSGTISLANKIRVYNPYLTVAGQTAPSPGITIKNYAWDIRTHDVLIQHVRLRVGDADPANLGGDALDALQVRENSDSEDVHNVVLDHVPLSWAVDEVLSFGGSRYAHDITASNCVISEGLSHSIHPEGEHSKGVLVGDRAKRISLIDNLMAHNKDRNGACIKGDTSVVALNNLIYDTGTWTSYLVADDYNSGTSNISIVNNDIIAGLDTPATSYALGINSNISAGSKIYFNGNRISNNNLYINKASYDPRVSSPPVWHPSLVVRSIDNVKPWVLAHAGARPADRDSVDERIVNEVQSGTGNIIDNPQQVGGWPNLAENHRTFTVPNNPNGDDDGDGYTNIEEVLQQMAAQVEGAQ